MPIEIIIMSQPHIDLEVDMVELVRDAFVVAEQIVKQATHDSCTTQQQMVGAEGGTRNGVPLQSQNFGVLQMAIGDHEAQLVEAIGEEHDHVLEVEAPHDNELEKMLPFDY
jgi:hypothetical protein